MRHDLLNRPSNLLTSIASGIDPLVSEVRSFEAFKQLHLGLFSESKRKTLPAIAQISGLDNAQSLHHFLTESPRQTSDQASGWKSTLNNLRSVIELSVILNLLKPWLNLFSSPRSLLGLECLIALMDRFSSHLSRPDPPRNLHSSSVQSDS